MNKFFISIFSAILIGILFAVIIIVRNEYGLSIGMNNEVVENNGEEKIDPTFISKFSRVFIYNSKDNLIDSNYNDDFIPDIPSEILSTAYIVYDIDNEKTKIEKNANKLLPIASLTKLATAVIAKRLIEENKRIEITKKVLAIEGNTAKFRLGEKFNKDELLYPLLMVSSNDAGEALALAYGRVEFIKKMNDWASAIGAYRTYFYDPSGLSPKNVSTARDIAIMIEWIKNNEKEILDITLTQTKMVRTHTWTNPNHLLNLSAYKGGKNGYIAEAGLTSVSLFNIGSPSKLYAVVLLGSKDRSRDTLSILNKVVK